MCVHINTMPDDDLLSIFDRVPLSDLVYFDQVCHRWACLLPSAFARRRTLVLIGAVRRMDESFFEIALNDTFDVSFNGRRPYYDLALSERDSSLKFSFFLSPNKPFEQFLLDAHESDGFFDILYSTPEADPKEANFTEMARVHDARLSGTLVTYFTGLFTNVQTLVVIHLQCYERELHAVIELLRSSWPLKIVKLWLQTRDIDQNYNDNLDHHPVRTLLQSINQQSTLQQLTLDIFGTLDMSFPMECYCFIAKLKVVKLSLGYERDNAIWDIVHRFDSTKLGHIDLGSYHFGAPPMTNVLNRKFEFTHKVRQLYLNLDFITVEQLGEFCWRYSSLSMLGILWKHNTFSQLVSNLANLTQLTHLKLLFRQHHENQFALLDQVEDKPQRVSLPQVKILELVFWKRSHRVLEPLSPLVFPSVEVIILANYFGGICDICGPDLDRLEDQMANECHELLVLSLRNKFDNSVRIYANHDGDEEAYVDWTNHLAAEQDDQLEIVDQPKDEVKEE